VPGCLAAQDVLAVPAPAVECLGMAAEARHAAPFVGQELEDDSVRQTFVFGHEVMPWSKFCGDTERLGQANQPVNELPGIEDSCRSKGSSDEKREDLAACAVQQFALFVASIKSDRSKRTMAFVVRPGYQIR